jgi:glycoside/pentoside/hexuronide:cation symporter, GPH family
MRSMRAGKALGPWVKIAYGGGDFGRASFNTLRMFFYAIFLTDAVGLNPFLASGAAFIAILWDAINDPLVGILSDRARTRWGRRRPFFLWFSIPFGLSFLLLWWAPPWQSQIVLAVHITLAYMIADTFQTLVSVPYLALIPELAPDYDDRTSLMTYRMFFNLAASLVAAGPGPTILDAAVAAGLGLRRGYLIMGALFGGIATVPFLVLFAVVRETPPPPRKVREGPGLRVALKELWKNKPFRYAGGVYVLNWISFDLLALMLPFYLLYWLAEGNLLAKISVFGVGLSAETAVFGVLLVTATATLPTWNLAARKTGKRFAYILGMSLWIAVQLVIWSVKPGRLDSILWIAVLAGIMTSAAHVIPESIFPDVIDWDELRTRRRREGLYYGAINFVRKLASALATFIALQILGWSGYAAPPEGATVFVQSPAALRAIRFLTGPGVILLLVPAIVCARLFPIDRERQRRIRRLLVKRRERAGT